MRTKDVRVLFDLLKRRGIRKPDIRCIRYSLKGRLYYYMPDGWKAVALNKRQFQGPVCLVLPDLKKP